MLCEHCQAVIDHPAVSLPPEFDRHTRSVVTEAGAIRLRCLPWELLTILYRRRDHMLSCDHLMGRLYGNRADPPDEDVLKVFICQIRKALRGSGWHIHCRWDFGYMLSRTPFETRHRGPGRPRKAA
jgi:DNA-binding response OmpR family regulator